MPCRRAWQITSLHVTGVCHVRQVGAEMALRLSWRCTGAFFIRSAPDSLLEVAIVVIGAQRHLTRLRIPLDHIHGLTLMVS